MLGLIKLREVMGNGAWLLYIAGLSLFIAFCLSVLVLSITLI